MKVSLNLQTFPLLLHSGLQYVGRSSADENQMESVVSSPVSGKVKRVLVAENDSIAQGDLVVEVTH